VYESAKGGLKPPEPHFFCGEQSLRRADVDYAFSEPPQSISMSSGQSVGYRRHLGLLPEGLDFCARLLVDKPGPALALARGLAAVDAEGKRTALSVGLSRAAGKTQEAMELAQQALARHPDSVEHHRLYQSVAQDLGHEAELVQTYKTRFDAAPGSADAAYLYARLLPDQDALPLATAFVQKFPGHLGLNRILIFRHIRERRFAEALAAIERVQAADRKEGVDFLEEQLTALAGLGRVDEAKRLAEQAFTRNEGWPYQLAAAHTWLSGGAGPAGDTLLNKLAEGDVTQRLELQVRFWAAPANASLAPFAGSPDKAVYALLQHAHYDPKAALGDLLAARAEDLSSLDLQVQILLLGEAHLTHAEAARQRLQPLVEKQLAPDAVFAYLDQGTWDESLKDLPLAPQGALHLARSRNPGLPAAEREKLRALAHGCDPLGGYVRMALSQWPS
jgi:hypothetical protein